MRHRPSRWISATARQTTAGRNCFEAKEASEAEVAEFMATQASLIQFNLESGGGYIVARHEKTGRLLVSGEHCLSETNGWVTLHKGDYSECLTKVRELKH